MNTEAIVEVIDEHVDGLGHLNHVQAVRYFESARNEWLRACGLYAADIGVRYSSVVVNINYDYKYECFLGEKLTITSRPESMGVKSYTLAHQIIKADGAVAVSGVATSVIMNMDERAIVPVPECMAMHLPRRK